MSWRASAWPSSSRRSMAIERLLRDCTCHHTEVPSVENLAPVAQRIATRPALRSLITSAPKSPSVLAANGPAMSCPISTTRSPAGTHAFQHLLPFAFMVSGRPVNPRSRQRPDDLRPARQIVTHQGGKLLGRRLERLAAHPANRSDGVLRLQRLAISAFSCWMIAFGVPAGTNMPYHGVVPKPFTVSLMVGESGRAGTRFSLTTPAHL